MPDLAVWGFSLVLLVIVAFAGDAQSANDPRSFDFLGVGLLVASLVLLRWRHRAPGPVALGVLALTGTWHVLGYASAIINVPSLVALYSLGLAGFGPGQLAYLGVGLGGVAAAVVAFAEQDERAQLVGAVGWTLAPFLLGQAVRTRRQLMDDLAERALRAERDRDAEIERRVEQERLRIARELHDVLAHTVSAMSVQAGVALDAFDRQPTQARDALRAMRSSSREAVNEIRATLSLLRATDGGPRARLEPAPSLSQVEDLVTVAREAGSTVELTIYGTERRVSSLVELTAYRVIQEALTNAMRHAGAKHIQVSLEFTSTQLLVRVLDDGDGAPSQVSPGLGLRGMAERVASCGGDLRYGRAPTGGFSVEAALPLGAVAEKQ